MRCRCWNPKTLKPKKMRLRSDGWKRCYRCGVEVMGLTLRAKLGLEQMARDGLINSAPSCEPTISITRSRRLPVAWRSEMA